MSRPAHETRRFDSLRQEVYLNLWRTYDRLRELEDRLFAGFELTAQQYNLLRLLQAKQPEPQPTLALAQRLISRAPDITRMLDRLEERNLIQRERPPENRRLVLVALTTAGSTLLRKIERPLQQCHEQQLGHLNNEQLQRLNELLRLARQPHEEEASAWR